MAKLTDNQLQDLITDARRKLGRAELELIRRMETDRAKWKPLHSRVLMAYEATGAAESGVGAKLRES